MKQECQKCGSQLERWLGFFFLFIILCVLLAAVVYSTIRTSTEAANVEAILIKILVSHFQVISLAAKFNLEWGDIMDWLFSMMSILTSISEDIPAIDCEISEYDKLRDIPLIYKKIIVFSIAPFIAIPSIYLFIKLVSYGVKVAVDKQLWFTVSSLVFVYMVQSSLAKQGYVG